LATLGTVLTVWAHPDDETYLAGGLLAALTDAGHRVVCVTATRGEAADPTADRTARDELVRTAVAARSTRVKRPPG
jgi:LmbE family N-acetylglucosaminyl deacetylase